MAGRTKCQAEMKSARTSSRRSQRRVEITAGLGDDGACGDDRELVLFPLEYAIGATPFTCLAPGTCNFPFEWSGSDSFGAAAAVTRGFSRWPEAETAATSGESDEDVVSGGATVLLM